MADDLFSSEFETIQDRRAYWLVRYEAALITEDPEAAAHAMERLRDYDCLISCIEGARGP